MSFYTRTKWDLILKLDGDEYRVVAHQATFALNRIPMASCTLAIGRDARTLENARIHETANDLGHMAVAEVILRPKGTWSSWQNLPGDRPEDEGLWTTAGEQVVFRGYLTGLGYRKYNGQLQVSVQLIHWLSDLSFSSIFSNQSHATNPSSYVFNSTYSTLNRDGTVSGKRNMVSQTRFTNYLGPNPIKNDVAQALLNVFCATTEYDLIDIGGEIHCGGKDQKNDASLAALKRIEGAHECAENDNKWHTKLTLDAEDLGGVIAKAIQRNINDQSVNSWWSTTIWDKLVLDFASSFLFHIVPRVETAILAPFVPGLRDTYRVAVDPRDIARIQISSYIRRPLRGVGIFAGKDSYVTWTDAQSRELTGAMGVGGCWMPDPDAKGMIMLKRAPSWLSTVPALSTPPSRTAMGVPPGGGSRKPTSTSTTPVSSNNLRGDARGKTGGEIAEEVQPFYTRYAKYLYSQEVLRGRQGTIAGKLRYDIAPGSNIAFRTTSGLHQAGDQLAQDLVASVMRVACSIDAEMGKAETILALAHVRTTSENASERMSVDSHPLYVGQKFTGAPLVDAYLFDSENP